MTKTKTQLSDFNQARVRPHRSVGYALDNLTTKLDVPTPYPRNLVLLSPEVMSRSFSLS
jgi:hypothetical protein